MMTKQSIATQLKDTFKKNREIADYSNNFNLRIHRSISWLKKAEETIEDSDICFISLWISFNAVYAREMEGNLSVSDRTEFRQFLQKICQLDDDKHIYKLIWTTYSGSIKSLLNNQYIFQPFWDSYNGKTAESVWKEDFQKTKVLVNKAIANTDTDTILAHIFNRLYTLRNQIIHGGATYNSYVNRSQLKDANAILLSLLPIIIEIMMKNHNDMEWGKPFYPPVSDDGGK